MLEKVVQDCDVAGCAFRVDHDLFSPFSGLLSVACRVEAPVCRATEDFRTEIFVVSETETSLTAVYRTLRYTACHLLALNGTCRKGSMAEIN